ncbi:hypothetical protein D3C77_34340 [compost metagenome]
MRSIQPESLLLTYQSNPTMLRWSTSFVATILPTGVAAVKLCFSAQVTLGGYRVAVYCGES